VPVKIQNFTVEGVSTDNSTNNCDVSLLLNGITPYVKVSSKGQNGPDDFSVWERIFNSNLHLNVGENKLTAKLLCSGDESNQITKYHSVNFTGTNETTSTSITKVMNSPSIEDNISPSNITEIVESEPTSSEFEDQTIFMNRDQIARNITSGPVIIPPSGSQESSMLESSPVNDSVIIPNATSSVSSSDNSTSAPVRIPPSENASSTGHPVPVNNQSYNHSNQVSKEIIEQPDSKSEENDDIPLILPTPSPRVTSDNDRVNSVTNAPVRDLSPEIVVENNNTDVSSSSSKTNTSSSITNQTVSEPHSGGPPSNVKIPDSAISNFTGSIRAPNASAIQFLNQSETTLVSNSSAERGENGSSIKALAGVDQIVNEGMEVILSGDSASTNSSQLSYEWRQVGGEVKASLGQQNVKQISFQAPAVDIDSKLTFRFIASANGTQISSDEVNVTINDIPQSLEENESSDSQDGEMSESDDNEDDEDT
jgi:hypothetical protein